MSDTSMSPPAPRSPDRSSRLLVWVLAVGTLVALLVVSAGLLLLLQPERLEALQLPSFSDGAGEPVWLHLKPDGAIPDGPLAGDFFLDETDEPIYLADLTRALRHAATDAEVGGVLLSLDRAALDLVTAEAVRSALAEVDAAGKPCVVWSKVYGLAEWYAGSPCTLTMHPQGMPMVMGMRIETSYYAGTMEKIGVQPDFEAVGAYKSGPESYERKEPSPAAEEEYQALLDSLFGTFVARAAEGRGMTELEVRALIDDPPMIAAHAVSRGLIDALLTGDQVEDDPTQAGTSVELESFGKYARKLRRKQSGEGTVAVLHMSGTIMDGESQVSAFGGSVIGDRTVVEQLQELVEDEEVAAVVLRINSPGGSGLASDVMWEAIRELDEVKPVVVSMGAYAASGGYYVSMPARHIVAEPFTVTGSIGVYSGKFGLTGLYEKVGVSTWSTRRGELAGLYTSATPFTDRERAKVREHIEEFYRVFVEKAAEGRERTWDEIHQVAQGRVWTGVQAVERGLVDELGGVDLAVTRAAELAGLTGEPKRQMLPRPKSFFDALFEEFGGSPAVTGRIEFVPLLPGGADSLVGLEELVLLARVVEREGLIAALPARVRVVSR